MLKDIIDKKVLKNAHYKVDYCVMVKNDRDELKAKLRTLKLKEGERISIGLLTGAHAVAGYVERVDGELRYKIVDPESDGSELKQCIRSAFPGIKGSTTKERLQVDYYSGSTFLVKSFMYFAKHGREMLQNPNGTTPAPLLKMAQKLDIPEDDPRMGEIVSAKKNLTLKAYQELNLWCYKGKDYNLAAIKAKYRYLELVDSRKRPIQEMTPTCSSSLDLKC